MKGAKKVGAKNTPLPDIIATTGRTFKKTDL